MKWLAALFGGKPKDICQETCDHVYYAYGELQPHEYTLPSGKRGTIMIQVEQQCALCKKINRVI